MFPVSLFLVEMMLFSELTHQSLFPLHYVTLPCPF